MTDINDLSKCIYSYAVIAVGVTIIVFSCCVVTVRFTVSDKDYVGKLSNHAMLQCSVFAHVKGKDQYWVGKVTQQFAMPTMLFSFPSGSSKAKKGTTEVVDSCKI